MQVSSIVGLRIIVNCLLIILLTVGAAGSNTEKLQGPVTLQTPRGSTFALPEGFSAIQKGSYITIFDSDREIDFFILELKSVDCLKAAQEVWKRSDQENDWTLDRSFSPPPQDDYDEIYLENHRIYGTQKFAQIIVRRKGDTTWAALIRSTFPALDKRSAQVNTILSSHKAPTINELDLSEKNPRSIAENSQNFSMFIEELIPATKTPGLAIAVVEGGRIVYEKGFGVREKEGREPVTPDTLMMIGSVSKSLTTLFMATLVDDRLFSWTDRVVSVNPDFKLSDADLTQNILMEHLVCACAGFPRKDLPLMFNYAGKNPSDVFRELSSMKPSTELKETFQYQNHMLAAAGYITTKALYSNRSIGDAYDTAMQARVFIPIGMVSSTLDFEAAKKSENRAAPHAIDLNGNVELLPLDYERFVTYMRPAGGIWSTARDMARYVITELNSGVSPDGRRVVSAENLKYRWKPQVAVDADSAYGLGWFSSSYKGLNVISHTGGTMGFACRVQFLPQKGLGVVMIANSTGGHVAEKIIGRRLLSFWFDTDENADQQLAFHLEEQKKSQDLLHERISHPNEAWMASFIGTHRNDEIGEITIFSSENSYMARINSYETPLMKHESSGEKPSLIFMKPPYAGFRLYPNGFFSHSFTMYRAQEKYRFAKKKHHSNTRSSRSEHVSN